MTRKPSYRAVAAIDPDELASFQAGIRKRYTDEQIAGTDGRTGGWLLIEHDGPWRHPALASEGLDREVVSELSRRIAGRKPVKAARWW